jgi:hypothetical protein
MMDALNLDCMDEGELNTFWLANSESELTHNRQRARYATHKRPAMQFRLQARINEANARRTDLRLHLRSASASSPMVMPGNARDVTIGQNDTNATQRTLSV